MRLYAGNMWRIDTRQRTVYSSGGRRQGISGKLALTRKSWLSFLCIGTVVFKILRGNRPLRKNAIFRFS